jgi:hypothetical protein
MTMSPQDVARGGMTLRTDIDIDIDIDIGASRPAVS